MAQEDALYLTRMKLFDALGDLTKQYCQLMKQWFSMKLKKEEFDGEVRKIMNLEQTRLHNEFLLSLLNKVAFPNSNEFKSRVNGKKSKTPKPKRSVDKGGFQVFQPADYLQFLPQLEAPPLKLLEDAQRYSIQDYFLPDFSFILGRLMLGSWEMGMKGADDNAAECLVVAVQYFLKNVLTAVITMRKGFKVRDNKLIHSIGSPIPNPWIRNGRKRQAPRFGYSLEDLEDDELTPTMPRRPLNETEREQQEAYELACAPYTLDPPALQPISAYDLIHALILHKSTVPSHSIYAENMERIISWLNHPTIDELEASQVFE